MSYLLNAPYGAVFELDGNKLVRVDGELVEAEEEPPGELVKDNDTAAAVGENFLECWEQERVRGEEEKNGLAVRESCHIQLPPWLYALYLLESFGGLECGVESGWGWLLGSTET